MKLLKILFCLIAFSYIAFPQATAKINSLSSLQPNTLITIPVEVSGIPNVCALDLEIVFDTNVIVYKGISKIHTDKFNKEMYKYYNFYNSKFRYNWISSDPEVLQNTILFYFDFKYIGGVTEIAFNPENCRFTDPDFQKYQVTYKNGLISGSTADLKESKNYASEFFLEQNFPNPFNPSTKIKFSLPETAKTRIAIYNITGAEVAEIVNSTLNAGTHEYIFNAGNLPSGMYLCKVTSGKYSSSKKMFLIK